MLDPIKIGLILVVAALVLGPEKLPEFARKVGGFMRSFRSVTSDMTKEFTRAMNAENNKPPSNGNGNGKSPS